jgi:glutamate synthase (ferredoxin)
MIKFPTKQGLYDPKFEHDACGMGFVAHIKGKKSHDIVHQALTMLANLEHRGGQGAEKNTGDGAGILLQIPHEFFRCQFAQQGIELPAPGEYGVGMLFLPTDPALREQCEQLLEAIVREEGQDVIGWRTVPTNDATLGEAAKAAQPYIRQVVIGLNVRDHDPLARERKLYVIRKLAERRIRHRDNGGLGCGEFYFCSLSASTIVYKGMLTTEQVAEYYPDLRDPSVESALALVHSRFSTNTFPSWDRAHPYRYLIHNGEINTLRGNINWMRAREALCESPLFGEDIQKILPIIDQDGSDSAMFDNTLEFLYLAGRSLPHVAMMMVPEPWAKHESMHPDKKAFYEYHSALMEPWDGPAAMAFTDGRIIGAILDRNGLRPSRYYITNDDRIILASEVGVLDLPPEIVVKKDRLYPGRMLLVDTVEGRIISDEELKLNIAREHPYGEWLAEHMVDLDDLAQGGPQDEAAMAETAAVLEARNTGSSDLQPEVQSEADDADRIRMLQIANGYTYEELTKIIAPMAADGAEAVGAMGVDSPLAVLSRKPQLLYNYFKQLFAQVTNPPIDAIREEIVTSTITLLGSMHNPLETKPDSCRMIRLDGPILTNDELEKLIHLGLPGFKSHVLSILYPVEGGAEALEKALDDLFAAADERIAEGVNLLILSDRGLNETYAAIPSLLAVAGLHHHLIRKGTRAKVSLIIETGEAREVHHFSALLGYGAAAINPYLAFETIRQMIRDELISGVDYEEAVHHYVKAAVKGIVKVLSKMGISTIQSYRGAQIFEAVGIAQDVIDRYFTWTPSRIGGIGLATIHDEVRQRHEQAFAAAEVRGAVLDSGGEYQWRSGGEEHLYNPKTIHTLQHACRTGDYELFKQYSRMIDEHERMHVTLRSLLKIKEADQPIPIEEVEPVESIVKRFKTGAMSYGSISEEAHVSLAIAMNRLGGKSNSGEGGEHPSRYGDLRRSAIKQVASGRFGVTSHYLVNADELQIKMAQGAKPGEGGQLPGKKVYPWIAEVRGSTPGVGLISPPPHHDIYSIEDLAELIHDLKNANPRARISVKLVSEVGVGTIAAGVAKGHADVILISGYDGGTGAAPRTSIKHAGLPWELGLAESHQTLVLNRLRDRVTLEVDGKLMTGRDVVIAAMLGAEEFGFSTAPLVALGCVMMRVCNLDTCPVGIATQNPELRKKFAGDPAHVENFMRFVAQEVREWMARIGVRSLTELVGRTELLEQRRIDDHRKTYGIDLSPLFYRPNVPESVGRYKRIEQDHGLEHSLDMRTLMGICKPALERKEPVRAVLPIRNTDRVVGTIVGSEVTRRYGAEGLPEDTIRLHFRGSAGQSFGAFLPKGMTLMLEGDANDYIGKGLSGGKIIVYPMKPMHPDFVPEENIIVGNVAFYGATGGEAYIRGIAGERFAVRNSGLNAVVEGVGDHGCEYMTGGRVVILGPTGRNFAAGMSGGIAYVLDADGRFESRVNREMVLLEPLADEAERKFVKDMIVRHTAYTGSDYARRILDHWTDMLPRFVKVIPNDYKRMIEAIEREKAVGLDEKDAQLAAFAANVAD